MPRNATVKRLKSPDKKVDKEQIVVEALVSGQTITAAAQAAGVDRSTIHRWMRTNYTFQAALDQSRIRFREELQDRLLALAEKCMGTVETAIGEGDARSAIEVLKGTGLLNGHLRIIRNEPADKRFMDAVIFGRGELEDWEKDEARELRGDQADEEDEY